MKIGLPLISTGVKLSPELEKIFDNSVDSKKGAGFGDLLSSKIEEADKLLKGADEAVTNFATGKTRNLHETVLALEMADTSLRVMLAVRNKALDAYQEIMRMPI